MNGGTTMKAKTYQVRPHANAWRFPGVGWETVLEVLELIGPMVNETMIYDIAPLGDDAERMMELWRNSELPGPVFADWIQERATEEHYALPRLLSTLRADW
jgi:hypothetical protein